MVSNFLCSVWLRHSSKTLFRFQYEIVFNKKTTIFSISIFFWNSWIYWAFCFITTSTKIRIKADFTGFMKTRKLIAISGIFLTILCTWRSCWLFLNMLNRFFDRDAKQCICMYKYMAVSTKHTLSSMSVIGGRSDTMICYNS